MNKIDYMKLAITEAKKAALIDEVPVGAVIVKDNKIIARAYNTKEKNKDATCHAEILAIKKASKKLNNWRLNGCHMYVTLEPCAMCASAISQARISELTIGLSDEKNGAILNGPKIYNYKNSNSFPCVNIYKDDGEIKNLLKHFFKDKRK